MQEVLRTLQQRGISIRVASKRLAAEEAPLAYKVAALAGVLCCCSWLSGGCLLCLLVLHLTPNCLGSCPPPGFILQDVDEVVEVCHAAGLSKKVVRLRPVAVVKG